MVSFNNIRTICVCGAGTMGSGIAQLASAAGYRTIQFDVNELMLEKSRAGIMVSLEKLLQNAKITLEEKNAIMGRIIFTSNIEDCKADIFIEAIIEEKDAKIKLFNTLVTLNNTDTIFLTNTSSISVTEIANQTSVASNIAGLHFFNPAPVMKLVEIVRTEYTHHHIIETLIALSIQMGKTPVVCKDVPGFIVNRVARHFYLEALLLQEKKLADVETIDIIMEATGFKMGPFKLMDLIGLDINYSVSNIVWEALGKPERLKPSSLQQDKVDKRELGRKTGKGFYNYAKKN